MTTVDTQLERTTTRLLLTLTDVDGVTALTNLSSVLTTFALTLFDQATGQIINTRQGQSVKNANGFSVYDTLQTDPVTGQTYNVLGRLDPADNAIVGTGAIETHIAEFTWTWGSPLKTGGGDVAIPVRNRTKVVA
jgi:hypothetical protein